VFTFGPPSPSPPAAAARSGVIPSTSRASLETLEETIDETRTADGTASHIRSYLTHGGRRQRPALPEELSEIKKIKQENETKRVQRVIAERSSVLASFTVSRADKGTVAPLEDVQEWVTLVSDARLNACFLGHLSYRKIGLQA
jgi:pantothenate synthetase